MLIREKMTVDLKFFASKQAYQIVRQLEKIMVKIAQAKVLECVKQEMLGP